MTPTLLSSLAGIALIFADGFETGDFSVWSSSRTDGGDLSVTIGTALVGCYGMSAVIDDNNSMIAASRVSWAQALSSRLYSLSVRTLGCFISDLGGDIRRAT